MTLKILSGTLKALPPILLATVAMLVPAQHAGAAIMEFYLNYATATEWELYVSTDHPDGVAAFSVNLNNATSGVSVAPEGWAPGVGGTGFTNGNTFSAYGPDNEAWAAQYHLGPSPQKVVLGLGHQSVPDAAFGPFMTRGAGNAAIDGLPGSPGFQLKLYAGTMNAENPAVFSPHQSFSGYLIGPPRDFGNGDMGYYGIRPTDYFYHTVPEPSSALLAAATLVAVSAIRSAPRRAQPTA
jgi:hypothetical protein